MLIDYATLKSTLDPDTLNNLCREFLIRQIGDEGFDHTDSAGLADGITKVQLALARGELVVEYSEAEESVAIRRREELVSLDQNGSCPV